MNHIAVKKKSNHFFLEYRSALINIPICKYSLGRDLLPPLWRLDDPYNGGIMI